MFALKIAALIIGVYGSIAFAETTALQSAQDLCGTYTGHWDMYALGTDGAPKLIRSWDDTIVLAGAKVAVDPNVNEVRAFGIATDTMITRIPANVPPITASFTEGFKIASDGVSAGDHYFTASDRAGNVSQTVEIPLGPNQWTYETPADVSSFTSLGEILYARNLTVKTLKIQGGLEVQTVTQTTTVVWKDGQGQIQAKSFVSMIGTHSRPAN